MAKYNKVTPSIRKEIVALSLTGKSTYKIADIVKVSQGSVCRALQQRKLVLNSMAEKREEYPVANIVTKARAGRKSRVPKPLKEPYSLNEPANLVTINYNGINFHLDPIDKVSDVYLLNGVIKIVTNQK